LIQGKEKTENQCYHCGDSCNGDPIIHQGKEFCCDGCISVFSILNNNDLCDYYSLNERPGVKSRNVNWKEKFSFLDKEAIANSIIQFSNEDIIQATFNVPSMHCSSCLWLLENIKELNDSIVSSRVDFIKKEVFIVWDPSLSLRQLVELLSSIGYEPFFELDESKGNGKPKPKKKRILELAVAGFAFSNIMMISLPDYFSSGHLDIEFSLLFKNLSVLLSLPVMFYCAREFFKNAYMGIKNKTLNIDAPIAAALIIIFIRSLYDIYIIGHTGYLDSLSGIVFFMLAGRWLQDRTNESLSFNRDYRSFFPIAVSVLKDGQTLSKTLNEIRVDDIIEIHHGEVIPADAVLSKGKGLIDYSFVTGESQEVGANVGELIYAGGLHKGSTLELIVIKEVSQSYLTNLWNKDVFKDIANAKASWLDMAGKYFTYVVFVLAGIAAIYWINQGESELMWNALTTVLIVACPCALLLAANYTQGHVMSMLAKDSFYLKNAELLEKLRKIDTIVFDKTGTITNADHTDVNFEGLPFNEDEKSSIYAMANAVMHPFSRGIKQYIGRHELSIVQNIAELDGKGFEANTKLHKIRIGLPELFDRKTKGTIGSEIGISINGTFYGTFFIGNRYREGIDECILDLSKNYSVAILSGDNDMGKSRLEEKFGDRVTLLFNKSPLDKLACVEGFQKEGKVLMVGDGLNDAGALKQSDFGLVITDNMNNFTPASDGILDAKKLVQIGSFLKLGKATRKIITICFMVSLIYNVVGLYFALQGILSPVIAAILMPLSSISMIGLTYFLSLVYARNSKSKIYDINHVYT